ncbi:dolichol-P-glucose synthetase [Halorubrum sp. DM2]|uniref:lysylphosphatidylglycerol synthase transmembrane domain-containing protein n=1 Tax=Halorubrum sp. DM2 TaxID=2527867 RepID=UPI0024B72515|nr:lysylphosphatidylglycerol synthase transmembrane domain-containing protein [Halorubrum sp. DM2]VTT85140.1 dolichol-P-glucose synthetase [Halorubrum sp. DM2]
MTERSLRARFRAEASRERLTLLGTFIVLGLGAAYLVRRVDLNEVVTAAMVADPALLGSALLVYVLSWPVRGRRYGDMLAAMGHRCWTGFLTMTVFASQTANLVVPARAGDGVRAYLLKERRDVPYPTGVASLAVERAFDLVAIGLLGGIALAFLLLTDRSLGLGESVGTVTPLTALSAAAGIAAVAVTLSAITVAVARSDRQFGPTLYARVTGQRMEKVVKSVVDFGSSVRVVAADPRSLGTVFLWSVVIWSLDVLTAVLVLAALTGGIGGFVPTPTLLVVGTLAVSVGNLAKVLPLSQGGIGLYEAAFTGLVVSATGLPVETALAAAILDHALKNVVTLVGGGTAALALGLSPTAGPTETDEPNRAAKADGGDVAEASDTEGVAEPSDPIEESKSSTSEPPDF